MGELMDKAKGKIKQVEGKITGDRARQAEGVADELKGKVKGKFEEVKTDIKRAGARHEAERDDSETPRLPRDTAQGKPERTSRP